LFSTTPIDVSGENEQKVSSAPKQSEILESKPVPIRLDINKLKASSSIAKKTGTTSGISSKVVEMDLKEEEMMANMLQIAKKK